ncbi:MAG: ATP-binding protein [Burkholderiaceae bacterium]
MIEKLTKAHAEGRLEEKLKLYTAPRLLIVDEIGYLPIDRVVKSSLRCEFADGMRW